METTTIAITKEIQKKLRAHMDEKGIKSYSFLIGKMFEAYIRKR